MYYYVFQFKYLPVQNHSPPSSGEVKKEWSYTSASPLCLRIMRRENLTFCLPAYAF